MIYYNLYKEDDCFTDILNDKNIMKHVSFKLKYTNGLILSFDSVPDSVLGYFLIKYGEHLKPMCNDYSPIPNTDYIPIKKISIF